MEDRSVARGGLQSAALLLLILLGISFTARYSYVLFHTLGEMSSIAVAWAVFFLAWNSRRFMDNHFFLFLGVAYLFVGTIDLLHTLAYEGMGILPGGGSNLAAQLWIAARYLESLSLVGALAFRRRAINAALLLACYSIVVGVLLGSIFVWRVFPDCFVAETGLTAFKKVSEYLICLLLLAALVFLLRRREEFDRHVLYLLVAAIAVTAASEVAFTLYKDVYGPANRVGHLLKIVSFYLIYKAIIESGLVKPYSLLFRNLRQSEQRLSAERERLFSVLDILPGSVHLLAPDCSIRFANGTFRKVFGVPADKRCYEILHGRATPCEPCIPLRVFDTREPVMWERRLSGGQTFMVYDNPFTDVDGSPLVLELALDITKRKKAEEALHAAVDFQKRILATAATAIFTVDRQQRITDVNEEFCAITGYAKDDVLGKRCDVFHDDPCRRSCSLFDPNRTRSIGKEPGTIRARDGRKLTVIKNAATMRDGAGQVTGGIESFVDVTTLTEAREAAEAASRAKSTFLANMSHELRTPVSAILGLADVLEREVCGPLNDEQKQCTTDIRESARHLLSFISDLLDLARIEVGRLDMELAPLTVGPEIEWSLLLLREKATAHRIELRSSVPDDLPPVMANRRALRQVLLNLLTNAIKFTPEDGRVDLAARAADGLVVVEVRDTGIGIAPDEIEKIFETFERSARPQLRSIEGAGLGLSLVRGLVEAMGGSIAVESEPDKGSCFVFTLSCAQT